MELLPLNTLGGALILIGGGVLLVGVITVLGGELAFFGRWPGDFSLRGKHYSIYFPLVTSIILSLLLTAIAKFFFRK